MHAVDARVVVAKALAADKFAAWCAELPPGCLVALEACGGAHHWARKLRGYGLDARLIAGHFVTPYRMAGKGRKNGAADAAAICEAATRPHMRFVPVKPPAQTLLASHQLRKPPDSLTQLIPACLARIFHRSRATNEDGIALVCPKIQVSNLDQRAGNAEAKLYRRN